MYTTLTRYVWVQECVRGHPMAGHLGTAHSLHCSMKSYRSYWSRPHGDGKDLKSIVTRVGAPYKKKISPRVYHELKKRGDGVLFMEAPPLPSRRRYMRRVCRNLVSV